MKYRPRLNVVLFQPEIPPNTGAIGRTCVAIGAKLWLVKPLGFQLNEKTLRRAGLDYWKHLEWEIVDDWNSLQEKLVARYFFLSKSANRSLYEVEFADGDAIVFGSESSGLPDEILDSASDYALRIPIRSDVRSLNLSCSVAITGYEFSRQLGFE